MKFVKLVQSYLFLVILIVCCGKNAYTQRFEIVGKVYFDNNANQIFDGTDSALSSGVMHIDGVTDYSIYQTAKLDSSGIYKSYRYRGESLTFSLETGKCNLQYYFYPPNQNHFWIQPAGDTLYVDFAIQPNKNPVKITGRIYYDNNQNNKFDSGDGAASNNNVRLRKGNSWGYLSTKTDNNGLYQFYFDNGVYNIDYLDDSPGYFPQDSKSNNDSNIIDFALQPNFQAVVNIYGQVFYDNDKNGINNGNDSVLQKGEVTAVNTVTSIRYKAELDLLGNFAFKVIPGTYTIAHKGDYNNSSYLPASPITGDFFSGYWPPYVVNMPLQPQPDAPVRLSGRVFYDNNGNNIFDGNDSAVIDLPVYVTYGNINNTINSAFTNSNGYYYMRIGTGKFDYQIGLRDDSSYILKDYQAFSGLLTKSYTKDTTDVIDFPIQKKDSIQSTYAEIPISYYPIDNWIANTGGQRQYQVIYGYDGRLQQVPATLSIDFSPTVSMVSSSLNPTLQSAGHLEWHFESLNPGRDTILFTLNFPPFGDTVGIFFLQPTFTTNVVVSNVATVTNRAGMQFVESKEHESIGLTNGVKWLRTFSKEGEFFGRGFSIDTAQNGQDIFVSGDRELPGYDRRQLFVAKLNKQGLSIWENNIDDYLGSVVKHTADGGCIAIGSVLDTEDYTNDTEIMITKYDSVGHLEWKKILGGKGRDGESLFLSHYSFISFGHWYGIAQLSDGGYLVTGSTSSHDRDFANKHSDTLRFNIFTAKFSATGELLWTKLYGGKRHDFALQMVPLKNGTFLILGATQSNDGDVKNAHQHTFQRLDYLWDGTGYNIEDSLFAREAWVINIDGNGNVLWSKCYGGSDGSNILGAIDNEGGYLLSGITGSKDGDLPDYEEPDIYFWLLQVSNTGNIVWSKSYKHYFPAVGPYIQGNYNYAEYFTRTHQTKDGNFVLAFNSADTHGSIKATHGSYDMVLVKITPSGDIIWQKAVGGAREDYADDLQLAANGDMLFTGNTISQNDDLYEPVHNASSLMMVGRVGISNAITGKVFIDANGNHRLDAGEHLHSEGRIYSAKQNDTTIARIFSGQFLNNVDTGKYVTTYVPASEYFTVFPASKNWAFTSFDQSDSVDFALVPKPNIKDLQTVITPLTPARPGFGGSYRVITKNVGTTNIANAVISLKKDSRQSYTLASRPNTGIAADSVWWGPFGINAFTNDTLDVVLTQAVPPTLQNGDTLNLTLYALPLAGDTTPANNKASLRQIVQGSFDPNDKTEAHAGIYTPTMKASSEPFQYLIRFQNTGTDTAFYVTVKDTLDAKVDVNSLETITASYPYKFSLEDRIATWQFNKILLADSTTNEPASHGFIAFSIKPSPAIKVGDSVENKAAIYFDFNLPVITNKNLLVLVSDKSVICPGGSTQFQAGPTGIAYQWQMNTGSGFANIPNGGIYSGVTTNILLLSSAPSILYGTQYRCLVTLQDGSKVNGQTYKLTFSNTWTGTLSSAWENGANWGCGAVPDENTDVIIKAGTLNTPVVNANTAVRSIAASAGAKLMVKSGVNLKVLGQ